MSGGLQGLLEMTLFEQMLGVKERVRDRSGP